MFPRYDHCSKGPVLILKEGHAKYLRQTAESITKEYIRIVEPSKLRIL